MNNTFRAAVCLVSVLRAAVGLAQEPVPVFRSSVAVVPIGAVVVDDRGRMVTTLKASDFEVRDNGEARALVSFHVDETAPVAIAVLVDTSGSMRLESKLAAARGVVSSLAASLRPGVDAVGLFTFDASLHELQAFTTFPGSLRSTLDDAAPFGATSLYDAIAETARRLQGQSEGRRAMLVLTDGVDTSSALAAGEVSARASALDVPVYIVATVQKIDQASYRERTANPDGRSTADARDLALWTGGDLRWATSTADAAAAGREILAELRQQYVMSVDAAADGAWRRLEVNVRDRRLRVRARSGYYVGGANHQPGR
jgi:Ca-activated chloride channel family protein